MQILRVAIPLFVSAALLAWLGNSFDLRAVAAQLLSISPGWALGAVLAMVANVALASWRYQIVVEDLTGDRPSFAPVVRISLLSLFFAQVLPAPVLADVLRGAASWRLLSLRPGLAAASIIHDRLLALLGIGVCMALALPALAWFNIGRPAFAANALIAVGTIGVLAASACLAAFRRHIRDPIRRVWNYAAAFGSHLVGYRRVAVQAALALAGSVSFALQLWTIARGLDIPLPLGAALAFAPAIYLSQVVPFVYAGFGAREAVSIAMMVEAGYATPAGAIAIGFGVGLTNILVSVPGAFAAWPFLNDLRVGHR